MGLKDPKEDPKGPMRKQQQRKKQIGTASALFCLCLVDVFVGHLCDVASAYCVSRLASRISPMLALCPRACVGHVMFRFAVGRVK